MFRRDKVVKAWDLCRAVLVLVNIIHQVAGHITVKRRIGIRVQTQEGADVPTLPSQ
jgi:hypothetical protein